MSPNQQNQCNRPAAFSGRWYIPLTCLFLRSSSLVRQTAVNVRAIQMVANCDRQMTDLAIIADSMILDLDTHREWNNNDDVTAASDERTTNVCNNSLAGDISNHNLSATSRPFQRRFYAALCLSVRVWLLTVCVRVSHWRRGPCG